jgi:phosphohistidine phosphatase
MKIYIIRHAIAEDREIFALTGKPDSERPLISKGMKKLRKVCSFLKSLESDFDLFFHSPYIRCSQTADILKEFYPQSKFKKNPLLIPLASKEKIDRQLKTLNLKTIALIGHEPDLGELVSYLLKESNPQNYKFKKSGIAFLELDKKNNYHLNWLLKPKEMIQLQNQKY